MTVLSKFFVRRGVKFPACDRVSKSLRCGPTRSSNHETPHWIGSENGNRGIGVLLAEEWVEKVYDICTISDRLMMIKLAIENNITVLSCYPPQVGLENTIKDAFL